MLNNLSGMFAEFQLATAFRSRKRFTLSEYFSGVPDTTRLNIINVKQCLLVQREDGKVMELDVVAESNCGRVVVVEVKKTANKTGMTVVEDFSEKIQIYEKSAPEKIILPAFLSLGGFTEEAIQFCKKEGIGTAETIAWQFSEKVE